jgi:hypothetical protein
VECLIAWSAGYYFVFDREQFYGIVISKMLHLARIGHNLLGGKR